MNLNSEKEMLQNAQNIQGKISNYLQWNFDLFHIEKGKQILDLGCGPGFYFDCIMQYSPSRYVAVDTSEHFLDMIRKKLDGYPGCSILNANIQDSDFINAVGNDDFDYILCFDVLEHIENDLQALKNIRQLLLEKGHGDLLLRVPALQFIYGENDRSIGHYRRYSKKSLGSLLESCSYDIQFIQYQNAPGIIPWYIIGKVLKRPITVTRNEGVIFNKIVPFIRIVERIIPPPLGLSLLCRCKAK